MYRLRKKVFAGQTAVEIARENELKLQLTKELSTAIRNLQHENLENNEPIVSTEPANAICNVLEAIFLHGCKPPVSRKIASYMGITHDNGSQPLNFWQFVEHFTHSDVTAQLKRLGQITTEIGLSRAWIRVALNDGLMASYVDAMVADKKILEYYYHRTSYFRDLEQPEILKSYLKGLMTFEFQLAYNSSLLNTWSNAPLTLAGIINADNTPLPVIHPAKAKSSTADSKKVTESQNGTVEAAKNISSSKNEMDCKEYDSNSDIVVGNKNKKHSRILSSSPARKSYITQFSSELTRSDVDEIRGMKSRYKPPSECSDSSHVSCPDSVKINRNPASYVDMKSTDDPIFDLNEEIEEIDEPSVDTCRKNNIENATDYLNFRANNRDNSLEKSSIDALINSSAIGEITQHSNSQHSSMDALKSAELNPVIDSYNYDPDISEFHTCNTMDSNSTVVDSDFTVTNSDLTVRKSQSKQVDGGENLNDIKSSSVQTRFEDSQTMDIVNTRILNEILREELCDAEVDDQNTYNNKTEEGTDGAKFNISPTSISNQDCLPKTKPKKRKERLKPELSPNHRNVVEPELSSAVAEAIETTKMDMTARQRFSQPDIQEAIQSMIPTRPRSGALSVSGSSDSRSLINDASLCQRESSGVLSSPASCGNSLGARSGWSSQFDLQEEENMQYVDVHSPQVNEHIHVRRNKAESFGSLLQSYTPASPVTSKSVEDVIQELPESDFSSPTSSRQMMETQESQDDFEFVMKTSISLDKPDTATPEDQDILLKSCECVSRDSPEIVTQYQLTLLGEIATEKGLDAQNYQCGGCKRPIGLIYGKPRLCNFDGKYYCFECHENEEYYIPAYIIQNWDFRKHIVSKKSLKFLQEIEDQSLIDLSVVNPKLYEHVKEMEEIHVLRRQLCHLKTYLFTCKQSVADEFRRSVWPKDYQYDCEDTYTLADLLQIPAGYLTQSLKKVIRFASKHVYGCPLCSGKGFICELCHSSKVIYPFEVDNTVRCGRCKSVFHRQCKTESKPCPKCTRRQRRETQIGESLETPDIHDYAFSPDQ